MMTISIILSLVVLGIIVSIHYFGLRTIATLARIWNTEYFYVPISLMFGIALLHLLEILIYAGLFYVLHNYTNLGGFTEEFKPLFRDYLYFSGANYTTLGMSDFYPTGHFKVLSISEALTGFMTLTWSATFFYSAAGQFLNKE